MVVKPILKGYQWIATHIEDVSAEEMARRAAEQAAGNG